MHKVLIILESEDLRLALCDVLQHDYNVIVCSPGEARVELLYHSPDAMVLDLLLSGTDGLSILNNIQDCRPPVILMLTTYLSPYVLQAVSDLGVGYVIRVPCSVSAIANHLSDMVNRMTTPKYVDAYTVIQSHLVRLGLPVKLDGYQQLCVGIPLFAQDPYQPLLKGLYPAIGRICECSWQSVEHSIREAIKAAWRSQDATVWKKYFPDYKRCPTNKEFIATLAELLK